MQFKNPEVLYFLALLIIPIIVHLFQLQKFKKTPFTNVAFLEQIIQQSRKSSQLKKWLILATRLLLFFAIVIAFSQPFFSTRKNNQKEHTFIYLDNSLSMDTDGEKGNLLNISTNEIIENSKEEDSYSLQTNTNFYKDITKKKLKKILIQLENTAQNIDLSTVFLKSKSLYEKQTKTLYNNLLISDFQNIKLNEFTNVINRFSVIQLTPLEKTNIAIDSIFISDTNATNFTINVIIKNQGVAKDNIPVAIFNGEKLMSKQTFSVDNNEHKIIQFIIQNQEEFTGKIQVTFNDTFPFDNTFYFYLKTTKKIDVLSIGKEANFLSKIYTKKEFNFQQTSLQNINYNNIQKQQLIILNGLENIPKNLSKSLVRFTKNGGNLVCIPNKKSELNSYNRFFKNLNIGKLKAPKNNTIKITSINFEHPFFKNVFSKKVTNFQYPSVKNYYSLASNSSSAIVLFENTIPFIQQINTKNGKIYFVASSLEKENGNFVNSPLVVPVFYNFGKLSYQFPKLFYRTNQKNTIDIDISLKKDEILSFQNNSETFIPLQINTQNKTTLTTQEKPEKVGFYNVLKDKTVIQKIAFNCPKQESSLDFLDVNTIENENITISKSIASTFKANHKKNEVQWLWKWFLALAIVSLLLEILILKLFKP